jgi:hypothetical protein
MAGMKQFGASSNGREISGMTADSKPVIGAWLMIGFSSLVSLVFESHSRYCALNSIHLRRKKGASWPV